MKHPFNLNLALAGASVMTLDGASVTEIRRFEGLATWPVVAVVAGTIVRYSEQGKAFEANSSWNLCMVPPTKKVWYALVKRTSLSGVYFSCFSRDHELGYGVARARFLAAGYEIVVEHTADVEI